MLCAFMSCSEPRNLIEQAQTPSKEQKKVAKLYFPEIDKDELGVDAIVIPGAWIKIETGYLRTRTYKRHNDLVNSIYLTCYDADLESVMKQIRERYKAYINPMAPDKPRELVLSINNVDLLIRVQKDFYVTTDQLGMHMVPTSRGYRQIYNPNEEPGTEIPMGTTVVFLCDSYISYDATWYKP